MLKLLTTLKYFGELTAYLNVYVRRETKINIQKCPQNVKQLFI
jgi:hypothetical protein